MSDRTWTSSPRTAEQPKAEERKSLDLLATPAPIPRDTPVAADTTSAGDGTPPADVDD